MKFIVFVEGFTEQKVVGPFLKRWLDPRVTRRPGIKPVRFDGWREMEKDMAKKAARTLIYDNILDHIPLAEGYSIFEIAPPASFLRKSLGELDLRRKYGVQVIVVKELIPQNVVLVPMADYVIKDSDILVMIGRDEDLEIIKNLK